MYTPFFHLSAQPFSIAPDPRFMFASQQHQEGLAHLLYGIQVGGGFVALTGEVGTGKTLLCHCLLQQLPSDVDIALILNPKLDAIELLASICDELGIPTEHLGHSLKNLVDALNKRLLASHAQGRRTVLMIDEAQNLSLEVLEQVRLLTNLETTTNKLLQIILVGQPELRDLLNRPALRQLKQRITAHYHLKSLNLAETSSYIQHRLMLCDGDPELFKPDAIRKIFRLSGGIPRLINRLCDRALLGGYAQGQQRIDKRTVMRAAQEANLLSMAEPNARLNRLSKLFGLGLGSVILLWGSLFAVEHWQSISTARKPNLFSPVIARPANVPSPSVQPPTTNAWITLSAQQHTSLHDALANALQIFSIANSNSQPLDCKAIEKLGVACFLDRSSWKEMLALKRPAILELELAPKQKLFVLFKGLSGASAILQADREIQIPLTSVLQYWNGYYLLVWKPPFPSLKKLAPYNSKHPVITWIRQLLGILPSDPKRYDYYDKPLVEAIVAFQKQNHLIGTGFVGEQTLIQLQNQYQAGQHPQLKLKD